MATAAEVERYNELVKKIAALRAENERLEDELELAVENMGTLRKNVDIVSKNVSSTMDALSKYTSTLEQDTSTVHRALEDLSNQYFIYKNLSTASKNITRFTDIYYTKYALFHKLRRITLGYIIGVDKSIISSEGLRKAVEKVYLQNTDYWLAYAITAVMLWASNEYDAAYRALDRSISKDAYKTDIFFLLVNLRYDRLDAAKRWYLDYLGRVNVSEIGNEYQYLLQAYLAGLFGHDLEFEEIVSEEFKKTFEKVDALTVDFSKKFAERAKAYADSYLHITEYEFPVLYEVSSDYAFLKKLLSKAECNGELARKYVDLAVQEPFEEDQAQRIENVLYDLINGYDEKEWKIIKKIKYNEMVIDAKGNLVEAYERYKQQYEDIDKKKQLSDMMLDWAFSEDPNITNLIIKRFVISFMKDSIKVGFKQFAREYRATELAVINVKIDNYDLQCNENSFDESRAILERFYDKDKLSDSFEDKYVKIFSVICLASVIMLGLNFANFNPIALVCGLIGIIVGGFVLWRRMVEVWGLLEEKKRLGVEKLAQTIEELARWREYYLKADEESEDIENAFELFD